MKRKKFDTVLLGILIGLIGPFFGFLIYGGLWSAYFGKAFGYFVNEIFLNIPAFQSSIVSLSLLFNLIPFFAFLRTSRYYAARGVLASIFIYVPVVIYLRFA
jgi:hypothetical protein